MMALPMSFNRPIRALCAGLSLAAVASQAEAQAPPGSYLQSCRDVRTVGRDLHAKCWPGNSGLNMIELEMGKPFPLRPVTILRNYESCVGDIWNFKGKLDCRRSNETGIPAGSYRAICRNIRVVNDSDLRATCRLKDGSWGPTHMRNFRSCRGDIAMMDGRFRCN